MNSIPRLGWWSFKKIIGLIVLVFVLIIVGRLVIFPLWFASKMIDTTTGIIDRTLDPDFALQNYEWFKLRYESVQATDKKILNAKSTIEQFKSDAGPRTEWSFEDKNESSRLNAVLLGLKNHRADLVAEYNAKSRMMNRKIFKWGDKVLPERLE